MDICDVYTPRGTLILSDCQRSIAWEQEFPFQGKTLVYNRIPFNNRSERAVEVPLAVEFLARRQGNGSLLELGNVLSHYENALQEPSSFHPRCIIDKFERGDGVENSDLMDVDSNMKFQTIISLSTVEHIGQHCTLTGEFGELHEKTDLEAPLKATAKLYDLLETGGCALLTVPFGKLIAGGWYVQFSVEYLDLLVTRYGIPREALAMGFLKQVAHEKKWRNPRQRWIEVAADDLRDVRYDMLRSGARAIAVLELTKLPHPFALNLNIPPTPLAYERSPLANRLFFLVGRLRRWVV